MIRDAIEAELRSRRPSGSWQLLLAALQSPLAVGLAVALVGGMFATSIEATYAARREEQDRAREERAARSQAVQEYLAVVSRQAELRISVAIARICDASAESSQSGSILCKSRGAVSERFRESLDAHLHAARSIEVASFRVAAAGVGRRLQRPECRVTVASGPSAPVEVEFSEFSEALDQCLQLAYHARDEDEFVESFRNFTSMWEEASQDLIRLAGGEAVPPARDFSVR